MAYKFEDSVTGEVIIIESPTLPWAQAEAEEMSKTFRFIEEV